jgi:hypothetical protein
MAALDSAEVLASVRARCQAAYSSHECAFRNAS